MRAVVLLSTPVHPAGARDAMLSQALRGELEDLMVEIYVIEKGCTRAVAETAVGAERALNHASVEKFCTEHELITIMITDYRDTPASFFYCRFEVMKHAYL